MVQLLHPDRWQPIHFLQKISIPIYIPFLNSHLPTWSHPSLVFSIRLPSSPFLFSIFYLLFRHPSVVTVPTPCSSHPPPSTPHPPPPTPHPPPVACSCCTTLGSTREPRSHRRSDRSCICAASCHPRSSLKISRYPPASPFLLFASCFLPHTPSFTLQASSSKLQVPGCMSVPYKRCCHHCHPH